MKDEFKEHVVISLDRYESMRDAIDNLYEEKEELNRQIDNLKGFMKDTRLPIDTIADGKYENIRLETQIDPINRSVNYRLSVTVRENRLYMEERARLYTENEQINED